MSLPRQTKVACTALAFFGVTSLCLTSLAQDEKIAAEAIFNDARRLMEDGRFTEACPKLAESQRLDPAVGTLLYLGECYEKEGKLASAWAAFRSAASAAHNAGQTSREQTAKQKAAELEPKLPKLKIVVPPGSEVPGLQVQRDDIDVGTVIWGSAVPVDPGKHRIVATAPGKKTWRRDIDVGTEPAETLAVLPRLDDDATKSTARTPPAAGATPPGATPPVAGNSQSVVVYAPPNSGTQPSARSAPRKENSTATVMHVSGISLLGVGVGGLAIGTYYELKTQSKLQDAKSACNNYPDDCSPQGIALNAESKDASNKATLGFVVGGGLVLAGLVVYLLAPSAYSDDRSSLQVPLVAPVIGPHELGWAAAASF